MARFCPHMIRRSRQKLPFWISKEWIRVKEMTFSDWEKSAKDSNTSGMRFKVPGSGYFLYPKAKNRLKTHLKGLEYNPRVL